MSWKLCDYTFDRTYEGLKLYLSLNKVLSNKAFDRTYEGLKPLRRMRPRILGKGF